YLCLLFICTCCFCNTFNVKSRTIFSRTLLNVSSTFVGLGEKSSSANFAPTNSQNGCSLYNTVLLNKYLSKRGTLFLSESMKRDFELDEVAKTGQHKKSSLFKSANPENDTFAIRSRMVPLQASVAY